MVVHRTLCIDQNKYTITIHPILCTTLNLEAQLYIGSRQYQLYIFQTFCSLDIASILSVQVTVGLKTVLRVGHGGNVTMRRDAHILMQSIGRRIDAALKANHGFDAPRCCVDDNVLCTELMRRRRHDTRRRQISHFAQSCALVCPIHLHSRQGE